MYTNTHTGETQAQRAALRANAVVWGDVNLLPGTEIGSLVLATSRPNGDRGRITVEQYSTCHACAFPLPSPISCAPSRALTHQDRIQEDLRYSQLSSTMGFPTSKNVPLAYVLN